MTTTKINTIEDLARILEEQPRWATALRSLLLGEDWSPSGAGSGGWRRSWTSWRRR